MTDVIAEPCTGVKDKAGAGDCPAGCICEGDRMLCIHPASASTVAAANPCARPGRSSAKTTCPGSGQFTAANAKFSGQFGSPGGAAKTGPLPTTPTTSPATSPAGNATMSMRQIPGRGRASGGPAPGSPPARAAPAGSR